MFGNDNTLLFSAHYTVRQVPRVHLAPWLLPLSHVCPLPPALAFLGSIALFYGEPQAGGHRSFQPQLAAGAGRDLGSWVPAPYLQVGRECRLVGGEGQLMAGCQAARKGVPQTCALSHYIRD